MLPAHYAGVLPAVGLDLQCWQDQRGLEVEEATSCPLPPDTQHRLSPPPTPPPVQQDSLLPVSLLLKLRVWPMKLVPLCPEG